MSPDCTSNLAYSQHFHRSHERFFQNLPAGNKCIRIFLSLHFSQMVKNCGRVDPIALTSRWEQIMPITCKAAFNRIANDLQKILHPLSGLGKPENRSWYIQAMHFGCIQSIPTNVFKSCKSKPRHLHSLLKIENNAWLHSSFWCWCWQVSGAGGFKPVSGAFRFLVLVERQCARVQ